MKAKKIMVAACVVAMALVSCNKEDDNPMPNNRMKSVEVSLKNVVISQTRGLAGEKISNGTPVAVSNFKVFLTDAAGNEYSAKNALGTEDAQTWWTTADLANGPIDAQFHYVDPNCTKIIAVANIPNDLTFAEYKALDNLEIEDEQDAKNLTLYDEYTLSDKDRIGQHEDQNQDGTTYVSDVYKAELILAPRISRFEVDGFRVNFSDTPKYNTIKITDMAFQNYYPKTVLATGNEAGELVNHMQDLSNQADVYNWFNNTGKEPAWYWDSFEVVINATDAVTAGDTPNPLAYHMFSCTTAPVFVIKLLADNQPAYLYSKGFYSATEKNDDGSAKKIENFEEGKIYRMSAAGASDGLIPIDEEDIDPMDRCLEITVDVVDWVVDLVYPEF